VVSECLDKPLRTDNCLRDRIKLSYFGSLSTSSISYQDWSSCLIYLIWIISLLLLPVAKTGHHAKLTVLMLIYPSRVTGTLHLPATNSRHRAKSPVNILKMAYSGNFRFDLPGAKIGHHGKF
jgi:hypothetical protein